MSSSDRYSLFSPPEGKAYIIAEIANAAQGVFEKNIELINVASEAKADAIKFQFYKYDVLAASSYWRYNVYERTFYTAAQRRRFIEKASEEKLDVWVDIFDRWGLKVAKKNVAKISAVKIPPTVILDEDLVSGIMSLDLPTAIGVGGYEDEDIDFVLSLIERFSNPIILMYGFQGHPTPIEDTTLGRIEHLKKKYGYPVGYADHVEAGTEISYKLPEYAFFSGAGIIEKHIILDRSEKGDVGVDEVLDYYSSLEPNEFKEFVKNIRRCEVIYGTGKITNVQKDYLKYATRMTTKKKFNPEDLVFKKDILFRRTNELDSLYPNELSDYLPGVVRGKIGANIGITKNDINKAVVGIIVVCRLSSTRLKNKALLKLNGFTAIERCLLNCLAAETPSQTVLATSMTDKDSELKNYTLNGKVKFFQGSGDDPAVRMLDAAKKFGIDIVVRITGDSPLMSYELIDYLIESHIAEGADFSYYKDAPLGASPEVVNVQAIIKVINLAQTMGYSEYFSLFFKNNPSVFSLNAIKVPKKFSRSKYRLNLDYQEDYDLLTNIFEGLNIQEGPVSLSSVIRYIEKNPGVLDLNKKKKSVYSAGKFKDELNRVTTIRGKG